MFFDLAKRTIDIFGGIFLIILFFPIMLAAGIAIKLTSPGPVFIERSSKHTIRLGKNYKKFYFYKFRSMIVDAEKILKTDPKFKKLYQEYKRSSYKLFEDPRVTPVGRFIRKYSIDEMPQLFNVLKGEMSIVGPRAYLPEELEEQQGKYPGTTKFVKEALTIKPGITGFWQVTGRSNVHFDKRIEMDAYYARKRSLLFDILIMLRTPWAMISGKDAV